MSHSNRDNQVASKYYEEGTNQPKEACAPLNNEPHFQFIDLCRRLENLRRQLYPTSQISYRLKPQSISIERPALTKPPKSKAALPSIAEYNSLKYGAEKIRIGLLVKEAKLVNNSEPCSNISFNVKGSLSSRMASHKLSGNNKLPLLAIKASLEGKLSEQEKSVLKEVKMTPRSKECPSEMKMLVEMLKPSKRMQRCNFKLKLVRSSNEIGL